MGELTGRVAIVTGAAQGIGAEYARGLARAGAAGGVCDILDPAAIVNEIVAAGGKALGQAIDITDGAAIRAFAKATHATLGGLDILVNNAAIFGKLNRKPLMEIEAEEWDKVMTVNVRGTFECVKAVTPFFRVNAINPGFTLSEAVRGNPAYTKEVTSGFAAMRAIKRDQQPEDLIGAAVFLASSAGDFISGQTLIVDGGMAMS